VDEKVLTSGVPADVPGAIMAIVPAAEAVPTFPAIVLPSTPSSLEIDPDLRDLSKRWVESRPNEQKEIIGTTVRDIAALGQAAQYPPAPAVGTLTTIGSAFEDLVLEGTLQQQLCCKLAIALGTKRDVPLPPTLIEPVIRKLIDALKVVVRVGAPTTRDSAVEGLGALLKLVDAEAAFPESEIPAAITDQGDSDFNARYVARLDRRRRLVLAVAGHDASLQHIRAVLAYPLRDQLDAVRAQNLEPKVLIEELERPIYERADILRTLPAMARQDGDVAWAIAVLCEAAKVLSIGGEKEPRVRIAFARYHESLFRTIDVLLRRDATRTRCKDFDEVVAAAVDAIPRTFVGAAPECNGQIRATVAIVRTAVNLVIDSNAPSRTKVALRALADEIQRPGRWVNLGIAEGWYRGLPRLVTSGVHPDLARPVVRAFLDDLARRDDDLISIHRRLIAGYAFRAILLRLAHEQDEARICALLHRPDRLLRAAPPEENEGDISNAVIDGVAFEKNLFARTNELLRGWEQLAHVEQVLLTRIVAVQLHKVSRQTREFAPHPVLDNVFASMPTHVQTDDDSRRLVFDLLSTLPAGAAAAADSDLHRFVERCGRMSAVPQPEEHAEDLPAYVLAMISANVSSRVADAVAREVDLSLRQERNRQRRRADGKVDFAKTLYQVMLRGPHEIIFQHLLPRLERAHDRKVADFFCRHVAAVRHIYEDIKDPDAQLDALVEHVGKIVQELDRTASPTLRKMRVALTQYQKLTANDEMLWVSIVKGDPGGGLGLLFRQLDDLAQFTHARNLAFDSNNPVHAHRKPLEPLYRDRLVRVQNGIAQYLKLSLNEFTARTSALVGARDAAAEIETALVHEEGLVPPDRVLLTALIRRLRDIFHRTNAWYCEEPQRRIEANEPEDKMTFWHVFTSHPGGWDHAVKRMEGDLRRLDRSIPGHEAHLGRLMDEYPLAYEILRLRAARGKEPPQIHEQTDRFEECYMEWAAGDLDIDAIKSAVGWRWKGFGVIYGTITNLLFASLLIAVPCLWAIWMDAIEAHWLEGAGYMLVAVVLVAAAVSAFSVILTRMLTGTRKLLSRWWPLEPPQRQYWFQAMLPRLAKLIFAPMVLIVEFDHSYEFPLHGSTWVLLLLMVLSFFTTRFFVGRELSPHEHIQELKPADRTRVRQLVAIALSHAFAAALVFSMFFATTHIQSKHEAEKKSEAADAVHDEANAAPQAQQRTKSLDASDEKPPSHHERPFFLGILPREVEFNITELSTRLGVPLPPILAQHSSFMFYPTIILTWTAMGLFFGVFLEGFLQGERVRLRGGRESTS
jgi:hypothetical protein